MIADKDISIVVQGPILTKSPYYPVTDSITKMVCLRLRELFPDSELILSTGVDESVAGISYDQVIFNPDPGATRFMLDDEKLNNVNRLIVSTLAGIKAATRPYVFKIRSDLFVVAKHFLTYFEQFSAADPRYQFVQKRIIAFGIFSVMAERYCCHIFRPFPYHVSDWAYFGYRTDLLNLYDIPLTHEPNFSQYFLHRYKPFQDLYATRLWKMTPEQYITSAFFKKYYPIHFTHTADTAHDNILLSARLIANNFLILDQTQFSLISLKYINFQLLFKPILAKTAIFYHTWLADYYRYSDYKFSIKRVLSRLTIVWRYSLHRLLNTLLNRHEEIVSRWVSRRLKKWCDQQNR